jgi:hypothetical protein
LIELFPISKKIVAPVKLTAFYESLGAKRVRTDNHLEDMALSKTSPKKIPQFIANIR